MGVCIAIFRRKRAFAYNSWTPKLILCYVHHTLSFTNAANITFISRDQSIRRLESFTANDNLMLGGKKKEKCSMLYQCHSFFILQSVLKIITDGTARNLRNVSRHKSSYVLNIHLLCTKASIVSFLIVNLPQ